MVYIKDLLMVVNTSTPGMKQTQSVPYRLHNTDFADAFLSQQHKTSAAQYRHTHLVLCFAQLACSGHCHVLCQHPGAPCTRQLLGEGRDLRPYTLSDKVKDG